MQTSYLYPGDNEEIDSNQVEVNQDLYDISHRMSITTYYFLMYLSDFMNPIDPWLQ